MRFTAVFNLASVLAALQVVAASNSTGLARCGEHPKIFSTQKIAYKDSEAVITTYECPGIVKRDGSTDLSSKRQLNGCALGCRVQDCVESTNPTPMSSDCLDLGLLLEATSGNFLAPPDTTTIVTYGTCATSFVNNAVGEYEYCYTQWGSYVYQLTLDCIPTYSGALCAQPTENWLIEIYG